MTNSPPAKNPITATSDETCRSANPLIACPEVHPPAYLAPNPTKNPPPKIMTRPGKEAKPFQDIISGGTSPEKSVIPKSLNAASVAGASSTSTPEEPKSVVARKPPSIIPTANARFQAPLFFQSYFRKSRLAGTVAAHMCLRFAETPNCLPPHKSNKGTKSPKIGPATYQGQG